MPVAREWTVRTPMDLRLLRTMVPPRRLLHHQIGSATQRGRAGRPGGDGTAEGRGGPATKPRRKRFMPTNELHTYQPRQEQDLPEGVAEQAECAGRVQHDLGLNNEPANLNNAIVDDEGGGRDDDRSRRGDDSAADGSAQAAQERLLNQQIGNVTPWGMTGRHGGGGGTAERRRRSASEPRGKGFRDIGVHTGQLPEGADRCAVAEKPEIEAMIAPLPLGESPASKPKGNDIPGAIAEGFQTMTIPPVPERVVCDPAEYITVRKLSKCSSGKVYVGRLIDMPGGAYNGRNAHEVVLKFEHRKSRAGCYDAPLEWKVYLTLNGCYGIPSVHYMGRQGDYLLIMDMLGPNLWDVRDSLEQKKMPFQMVARIAVEAISIIEKIHSKGFVHGDVKPENLLLGQPGSAQENKLFLINFGLASNWKWERGSSNWKWFFTCPRRPLAPPHRSPPPRHRRPPCRPGPRAPPL